MGHAVSMPTFLLSVMIVSGSHYLSYLYSKNINNSWFEYAFGTCSCLKSSAFFVVAVVYSLDLRVFLRPLLNTFDNSFYALSLRLDAPLKGISKQLIIHWHNDWSGHIWLHQYLVHFSVLFYKTLFLTAVSDKELIIHQFFTSLTILPKLSAETLSCRIIKRDFPQGSSQFWISWLPK